MSHTTYLTYHENGWRSNRQRIKGKNQVATGIVCDQLRTVRHRGAGVPSHCHEKVNDELALCQDILWRTVYRNESHWSGGWIRRFINSLNDETNAGIITTLIQARGNVVP